MDFYKRVGITVRTVPEGKVATYGQIALLCGKPKNARQVGYASGGGRGPGIGGGTRGHETGWMEEYAGGRPQAEGDI